MHPSGITIYHMSLAKHNSPLVVPPKSLLFQAVNKKNQLIHTLCHVITIVYYCLMISQGHILELCCGVLLQPVYRMILTLQARWPSSPCTPASWVRSTVSRSVPWTTTQMPSGVLKSLVWLVGNLYATNDIIPPNRWPLRLASGTSAAGQQTRGTAGWTPYARLSIQTLTIYGGRITHSKYSYWRPRVSLIKNGMQTFESF